MYTYFSVFAFCVILCWLWKIRSRPQTIRKPEGKPLEVVRYELHDYKLPNLKGRSLVCLAHIANSVLGKWFVIPASLRCGKTNPSVVAQSVLQAIVNSNANPKPLRTFVQIDEKEVKQMAAASTKRYEEGTPLSIFDGIPIGIKEQMAVKPYYLRCGTTFMGSESCTSDASVVKKLREAGAVIIGMTNLHEVGAGTLGSNPNGLHGTPRNPYDIDCYTGGSSSGSAAAVAAGLIPLAIGTDGGGSLRIPSSLCGVVTLKATHGRLTGAGQALLSATVGDPGPICSCVRDVALAYDLLAGPDSKFELGLCQPPVQKCSSLKSGSLSGITIGIYSLYFKHGNQEVVDICQRAVEGLCDLGAEVIDIEIPELEEARVAHSVTISGEMASFLRTEQEEFGNLMNSDIQIILCAGGQVTLHDYLLAQQQRTRSINFLKDIFNTVDCIVTPSCPITAPPLDDKALEFGESNMAVTGQLMRYMFLGNLTGVPCMTLPVGYDSQGLPIGLQIMGKWWDEQLLFRVALAAETLVEKRKPQMHYSML
ncbi:uncharacterized protein LOC134194171 isoform X2 [Corticium candelabrum]|uniref:uncharacterized protein LOC134194171 isoform X2 n=1 Tax=Corticium candelabrum TaxID=121492 RepID=UPI002E259134|nr:uncharacterized protein LOC134194171 isoform X2 [Corticium candelabrum]